MRDRLAYCLALAALLLPVRYDAQKPDIALQAELRDYVHCYAKFLGITPRWKIEFEFNSDSLPEGALARTNTNFRVLYAQIVFSTAAMAQEDKQSRKSVAAHEALHVFTAELAGIAWNYDPMMTHLYWEQLVRQMERWTWWGRMCG